MLEHQRPTTASENTQIKAHRKVEVGVEDEAEAVDEAGDPAGRRCCKQRAPQPSAVIVLLYRSHGGTLCICRGAAAYDPHSPFPRGNENDIRLSVISRKMPQCNGTLSDGLRSP